MAWNISLKTPRGLIAVVVMVLLISFEAAGQNEVAIGSATTKSNAILWLNGNGSQGLILPVVTNKSAVSNPDKGMIVYDDSDSKVWYRNGSSWVEVGGGTSSTTSLTLQLTGNQLQLMNGTTVQSTVNIAGGTATTGAFMIWNGNSWQYTTLSDVDGTSGQVGGIKGKAVPALPATTQALVYDGTAWKFQALTGGTDSQTLTFASPNLSISNGNSVNLSALDKDAQTLSITGSNLSISGGNSVTLPSSTGLTSITAGTGLTGGTITTAGTINVDVGTAAGKIVQLDGTGKLPAIDGSQLTNLPVGAGDITDVIAGTGLTGGGAAGAVTLNLSNSGITSGVYGSATAIPQMTIDAQGRITAVTTFAPLVADGSVTGGAAGAGVKIAANTITDANIAGLDAGKIVSGTLLTARIPNLDASKITTGTFSLAQIPNLDASKITTGTFNTSQIPNLDASKITTGVISTTQGGTGLSMSPGSIGNGQLLIGSNPGFTKANLTAGSGINITNGSGSITISATATGGTVTNVATGTGLTGGPITGTGTISLTNTAVTPAIYGTTTTIPQITIDQQGRITSANNQAIPNSNTATTGLLSATDWNTFNNKGVGTVTNVTGSAPISVATSTTTPVISMTQATTTTSGFLSSADWNTFNSKGAGTVTSVGAGTGLAGGPITAAGTLSLANTAVTPATYGTTTAIPQITIDQQGRITSANNQAIPTANTSTTGLLSLADWNTFNGKGSVTNVTGTAPIIVVTGTSTPVISLANTAVTPGTYGTTITIPQLTVDAQGRVTAANNQNIPTASTSVSGLLSNTDWNTFNTKGTGTVTSVSAGTGLTGGPVTTTGTLSLANTAVTPATYGTTTTIPQIAIDQQGRITSANDQIIPTANTSTTGLLSNTDWNTFNAKGSGSVTSVALTMPSIFTVAGTPITTSGTLAATLASQGAATIFAAPAGSAGVPTFRSLVSTDIPNLNASIITSGTFATAQIPSLDAAQITTGVLPVSIGGTGKTTWSGLAYGSGATLGDISNGTPGQFLQMAGASPSWQTLAVTSTDITDGAIVDIDVSATAGIAGTKISPAFGAQNISTTGTLTSGNSTTFGTAALTWPAASAAGVLTNDGTGALSWAASNGWKLQGNLGTNTVTDYLGTGDATNLSIRTDGTERILISGTNGNVGIGGTPSEKLDVTGNIKFSGALMPNNLPGTANQVLTSQGAGLPPIWAAAGSGSGWSLTGDATVTSANFIGPTTAGVPFNIRVYNTANSVVMRAGWIDPTNKNTTFGEGSGRNISAANAFNTAMGYFSLAANTTGVENTSIGYFALLQNTASSYNTAVGKSSLFTQGATNVNGSNTAIGYSTLYENTTGYFNTSLGYLAGSGGGSVIGNTTGFSNTFIGANSGPTANNFSNATTLGAGATVNASNKIRLGNASVTVIEGQVAYTAASDRRLKQNIKEMDLGINFIKKLKPVSYQLRNSDGRLNWGFIAQDIEALVGTDKAVLTIGQDSLRSLGLRYTDFIAPMVKAMQEQQQEIEELKAKLKAKDEKVSNLEGSVTAMKDELENIKRILGVEAKAKTSEKNKK